MEVDGTLVQLKVKGDSPRWVSISNLVFAGAEESNTVSDAELEFPPKEKVDNAADRPVSYPATEGVAG
jgi:hypothetical protein